MNLEDALASVMPRDKGSRMDQLIDAVLEGRVRIDITRSPYSGGPTSCQLKISPKATD